MDVTASARGLDMTGVCRTVRHVEYVMGTAVSIAIDPGPWGGGEVAPAMAAACARLHRADELFSPWKPASAVSRMQRRELRACDAPRDVTVVLELCRQARRSSEGWFDPWALPGGLDPSGLVKGWAAQDALSVLRGAGMAAAMVNAGGDVATFGRPDGERPWVIGIRDPADAGSCVCALRSPGAVATSGSYERGAHVLDPRTGLGADAGLASATVAGPEPAVADALATGLLAAGVGGLKWLASLPGYSALVIDSAGRLLPTLGLPLVEGAVR